MNSADGMGVVFQPLSLPAGTASTISPIFASDLACSLEYTRFVPFGYKLITFDRPQPTLDPPARIYWQVADRYRSLEQTKFLTVPSPGIATSRLCTAAPLNRFLRFCEFTTESLDSHRLRGLSIWTKAAHHGGLGRGLSGRQAGAGC